MSCHIPNTNTNFDSVNDRVADWLAEAYLALRGFIKLYMAFFWRIIIIVYMCVVQADQ